MKKLYKHLNHLYYGNTNKTKNIQLYHGNNIDVLKQMESESVDCVVTSPPYWGLRDYGTSDQLGLEPTPEEYVTNLVKVFQEVHRVLKPSGTVWLNLGDSYYNYRPGGTSQAKQSVAKNNGAVVNHSGKRNNIIEGLKEKDLVGIPWRVAFALQADGWYLRSDIIWQKPNPMPESVKDRPTKSHEYIFLLTKSKKYYYDADAIKEPTVSQDKYKRDRDNPDYKFNNTPGRTKMSGLKDNKYTHRNKRDVWNTEQKPYAIIEPEFRKEIIEYRDLPEHNVIKEYLSQWRKKANLTIQEIEDHFNSQAPHHWFETNGSYPSSVDWEELKLLLGFDDFWDKRMTKIYTKSGMKQTGEFKNKRDVWSINTKPYKEAHFAVFPEEIPMNCIKAGSPEDGVVLDPFVGSGTTLKVARQLGRKAIGIDINTEYLDLCIKRCNEIQNILI